MGRAKGWRRCLEHNTSKESQLIRTGLSSEQKIVIAVFMLASSSLEDTAAAIVPWSLDLETPVWAVDLGFDISVVRGHADDKFSTLLLMVELCDVCHL